MILYYRKLEHEVKGKAVRLLNRFQFGNLAPHPIRKEHKLPRHR
jgi:hypothetical protein